MTKVFSYRSDFSIINFNCISNRSICQAIKDCVIAMDAANEKQSCDFET